MVAISQIEVQTFLTFQILLENLTTNMMYSLRIQGSSESLYSPGKDIQSLFYVTLHKLSYMCYIICVTLHVLHYILRCCRVGVPRCLV